MRNNGKRTTRKTEATVRQDEYDALTTEQKIARCATRRGESKKELARLRGETVE